MPSAFATIAGKVPAATAPAARIERRMARRELGKPVAAARTGVFGIVDTPIIA